MRKTWLKKLNYSVLKKKTPLLGLTVMRLFILFVVVSGGIATVIASQYRRPVAQVTSTNLPTYETDTKATAPTASTVQQDNTIVSSGEQNPTTKSTPTVNNSLPDQYGCIPGTDLYNNCVKTAKANELYFWCSDQQRAANATYNIAFDQAQAAYNEVMAYWDTIKDQPYYTHNPYSEYATDAKTKYNAIIEPAHTLYTDTINSLNSQGCNLSPNGVTYYVWPI